MTSENHRLAALQVHVGKSQVTSGGLSSAPGPPRYSDPPFDLLQ